MSTNHLELLRLMQLCDSASPIGATAHSFGMETLAAEGLIDVGHLDGFLRDYMGEAGLLEAGFCRAAHALSAEVDEACFDLAWSELIFRLGALKLAREGRTASAMLGRRFLLLVLGLEEQPRVRRAVEAAQQARADIHYSAAFGLVCGVLGFDTDVSVLAYLQQIVVGLVSACQRLLPLGQSQASRIVWDLKPAILDAVDRSRGSDLSGEMGFCFMPLVDIASMRHPSLSTRLFIS